MLGGGVLVLATVCFSVASSQLRHDIAGGPVGGGVGDRDDFILDIPDGDFLGACVPSCVHGTCDRFRSVCRCISGYRGPRCDQRIPRCSPPCVRGLCTFHDVCHCPPGWQGPACNTPLCNAPACLNGGVCAGPNQCRCPSGWTGSNCGTPVCTAGCANGGHCININQCSCPHPYHGSSCQHCRCQNGRCTKGACICNSGYTGNLCQTPVCSQSCYNGGTCVGPNSCRCAPGWSGSDCSIRQCSPSCVNGGRCSNGVCQCPFPYAGVQCESCRCRNNGRCLGNTCSCPRTHTGPLCEDCRCQNGGSCANGQCNCPTGYTGPLCEVCNCQNGGTCVNGGCSCPAGFTGPLCQVPYKDGSCPYSSSLIGKQCLAGGDSCELDSECPGIKKCCNDQCTKRCTCPIQRCEISCQFGFKRDAHGCQLCTCKQADDCYPSCTNGGTCVNGRCRCPDGSSGTSCQAPSLCYPPCQNGGVCIPGNVCKCPSTHAGCSCEVEVPVISCTPECQNGGTCVAGGCTCPAGFTGDHCQETIECTGEGSTVVHHGETCTCQNGKRVGCCRIRKEVHDLTDAERLLFINTFKAAYTRPDCQALIRSHQTNFFNGIHTPNQFLPWHRWFMLAVENCLRQVNPNVVMHYWDWSLSSSSPWTAPVWTNAPHYYGGDGSGGCVTTGPFRQGQFTRVSGGCLNRRFSAKTPSALEVNDVLSTTVADFGDFEVRMRGQLHNTVHCRIGGTMCSLQAAETPDFFLHHTYVDKLWNDWQNRSTDHFNAHFSTLSSPMTEADGFAPRDLIDLGDQPGGVCVRYQDPQTTKAVRLRSAFRAVAPSLIARALPCKSRNLQESGAVQEGHDLFRVAASERTRLQSFLQKQVCRVQTLAPAAPAFPGAPAPPAPVDRSTPGLGFSLEDLEGLGAFNPFG